MSIFKRVGKVRQADGRRSLIPAFMLLIALCLLPACSGIGAEPAATPAGTSIPVAEPFQLFYTENGGRAVFGDTLTDAFILEQDSLLVQYFQNARLQTDNSTGSEVSTTVSLFPIGEWALAGLDAQVPAPPAGDTPGRLFPETSETVQGEFLQFYEANRGELTLGSPISAVLDRDGQRAQYFQYGRLDYYPQLPSGQQVQIGPLGQAHFDAEMSFTYSRALSHQFVPANTVSEVSVYASVSRPTLYAGEDQLLYLTILTPDGRSVSGLQVDIDAIYGENTRKMRLTLDEGQSKAQTMISTTDIPPGERVELHITVHSGRGDLLGENEIFFRTWW